MPSVRFTRVAEQDLSEAVEHIAASNPAAAHGWLEDLQAVFRLLAGQPEMGQLRQTRRFGRLRGHTHKMHIVFYRPTTDGIEIVRLLHGARQHDRLL